MRRWRLSWVIAALGGAGIRACRRPGEFAGCTHRFAVANRGAAADSVFPDAGRRRAAAGSSSILQDDTGIPFALLNTAEWDVRLYGEYAKPIKEFSSAEQPDLAAAFAEPRRARPLPFTWGYHWRSGISQVILAIRRETAQAR